MANEQPLAGWRKFVAEANPATATSFEPATPAGLGPIVYHGDRNPSDPAVFLDGRPLEKLTSLRQRALDLHGSIPSFDDVQQIRLEAIGHKNRISDLTRHQSEGGYGLPMNAAQVLPELRLMERAEQELIRLTSLQEIRTGRWNVAAQLDRSATDWLLQGVPGDCVIEAIEDAPLSELLTKADGGRIDEAVRRYQLRLRELAADRHRVNSAPWPSSLAKAAARELVDRLGDQGQPILDGAIEFGQDISFATKRLKSEIFNVANSPAAIAFASDAPDAVGLIAWLFRNELIAKIDAGFDEIAEDKIALSAAQREEMLATISADSLAVERLECACVWHADAKGEVLDFRADTSPQAVLGVTLRTVPRATELPPTSPGLAHDLLGGRR